MDHRLSRYHTALDYLFERTTGGSRFGLERTTALLTALGNPHLALRTFHVAGTNGKGSVCATLEALLRHRGLRVGRGSRGEKSPLRLCSPTPLLVSLGANIEFTCD